jgi:DNA-directed RNA polymerase subunit F
VSKTKKETELTPEDKAAVDFLKKNDFLTKEDLERAIN